MDIEIANGNGDWSRVSISGRVDSEGVDRLESQFNAATVARGQDAVIDLSSTTFLASMGIRMLVTAAQSLAARGRRLVLLSPSEAVAKVLDSGMIGQIIPIVSSESEVDNLLDR